MGVPSFEASNAIIYLTYGAFLYGPNAFSNWALLIRVLPGGYRLTGVYIAWNWRHQSKTEFLAANRTQKGQMRYVLSFHH